MTGQFAQGLPLWCTPDPVCESHDDVLTLFSAQQSFRGLAQASLTLFRLLGQGLHRLDCPDWLDLLYVFCVMGLEAFWPVVYTWVVFTILCCAFRSGCLRPILT